MTDPDSTLPPLRSPEARSDRAFLRVIALAVFLLAAIAIPVSCAMAQQLDQRGCAQMAVWGADIAWARDMGADKEKVREFLKKNQGENVLFRPLLRYLDFLWGSTLARDEITTGLFQDCVQRNGNYGTGI